MWTEKPKIARPCDGRPRLHLGQHIGRVIALRLGRQPLDAQVNLAHFEAGRLEAKVEIENRELLELLSEQTVIPHRVLGQPVVCDHESFGLGLAQMVETNGGDLGPSE